MVSQEAVWIDRRQHCPFSFQHGHADSPQVGYLISLCCCLFSCRMTGEVLKKKTGCFFSIWKEYLLIVQKFKHCRHVLRRNWKVYMITRPSSKISTLEYYFVTYFFFT